MKFKKSYIVVFIVLLILLSIWVMSSSLSRSPIDISTEEGLNFSWKNQEPFDLKNAHLHVLYGSPYVVVSKSQTLQETESGEITQTTLNLIDIERGKRILKTEWKSEFAQYSASTHRFTYAFAIRNHPRIVVWSIQMEIPFYYRFLSKSSLQARIEKDYSRYTKTQYITLDESGTIRENSDYPDIMYPPIRGNDTFTAIDSTHADLVEFRVSSEGQVQENLVWKGAGIPSSCYPLEDGSYFGSVISKKGFTFFLHSDPPTFRDFTRDELICLYPSQLSDLQTFSMNCLTWFQATSPSILVIPEAGDYPMFEVHTDKIASGSVKEIFTLVGTEKRFHPFAVLHDNTALVLLERGSDWSYVNKTATRIYMAPREVLSDGSLGMFKSDVFELISDPIFQPSPLDSERLIFIHLNALWTVKWDGSEMQRVFPR